MGFPSSSMFKLAMPAAWAAFMFIGCAPASTSSGPRAAGTSSEPTTSTPVKPFARQTHEERLDTMGLRVFPAMKAAFQSFDSKSFGDFRCQTCHGDGFDRPPVDFRMPNALPALSATDPVASAMDYDPRITRFMVDTVVPTMAHLLGEQAYDPVTKHGFYCFNCHPRDSQTPNQDSGVSR
jgi:hypothetical protein